MHNNKSADNRQQAADSMNKKKKKKRNNTYRRILPTSATVICGRGSCHSRTRGAVIIVSLLLLRHTNRSAAKAARVEAVPVPTAATE
jgi:hypothetical protein